MSGLCENTELENRNPEGTTQSLLSLQLWGPDDWCLQLDTTLETAASRRAPEARLSRASSAARAAPWGLGRCCCCPHHPLHPFPLLWWFPHPCRDAGTNHCQVLPTYPAPLPPTVMHSHKMLWKCLR